MWNTIHSFDWWSVKIDFGVNDQQWIAGVKNVIVDTDTIKILLEERLEEHVLFFECGFLLFDGKLVEENLIVSLVEVIKKLELIVLGFLHSLDLLNINIWNLFHLDFITLVEWKNLLFLSLKFSAELSCLKNLLSKLLILGKLIHASFRVVGQITKSFLFLLS